MKADCRDKNEEIAGCDEAEGNFHGNTFRICLTRQQFCCRIRVTIEDTGECVIAEDQAE